MVRTRTQSTPLHARSLLSRLTLAALGLVVGGNVAHAALSETATAPLAPAPLTAADMGALVPPAPDASGPVEVVYRSGSRCDRLERRLSRSRDDRTLNERDFRRLRRAGC